MWRKPVDITTSSTNMKQRIERETECQERKRVKDKMCVCDNKAASEHDIVPTGQRAGAISRDITADIPIINADVGKQMTSPN